MSSETTDLLAKIEAMAAALAHASGKAKATLQREYLELVRQFLTDQGRGDQLAFPMLDLIEGLDDAAAMDDGPKQSERRVGAAETSDTLLAQACAVIDILISSSYSSDHACQLVTRQMIARGVPVPPGGDARAWRNLQSWRHKLINTKHSATWSTYQRYKDELMLAYGSRLAEAAAREAIWDRRSLKKAAPAS